MCAVHHSYLHNGKDGGDYAVCPVIHTESLILSNQQQCMKCKVIYPTTSALLRHWGSQQDHSPEKRASKPLPAEAFKLLSCSYCAKSFYEFLSAFDHVKNHLSETDFTSDMFAIKLLYILKPRQPRTLTAAFAGNNAQDLEILTKTLQYFKYMGGHRINQAKKDTQRCIAKLMQVAQN